MIQANFSGLQQKSAPFPHLRFPELLSKPAGEAILDWFDTDAPWRLKVADFYEQLEFSLLQSAPPTPLDRLVQQDFVDALGTMMSNQLDSPALEVVDVVAHRMIAGQTIRIHNDFLGGEETHRCVIQINRGWQPRQGGLLMLFANDDPESVTDVLPPLHRSAFSFEISERSHHAVSTVHEGKRDTIVYTYRPRRL